MQRTSTRLKRKPIMYVNVVAFAMALGTVRDGSLASSAMLVASSETIHSSNELDARSYRAVLSALVMIQAGVKHPNRNAKPGGLQPDVGWKSVKAYWMVCLFPCWASKVAQAATRTQTWKTTYPLVSRFNHNVGRVLIDAWKTTKSAITATT